MRADGIRYTHRYLPAEGIGGDIYSIVKLPDGGVALMIADVSGHGVTAALISAMVKIFFEGQVRQSLDPLAWAQAMNRDLTRHTMEEQFATQTYTLNNGRVTYSKGRDHVIDAVRCMALVRERTEFEKRGTQFIEDCVTPLATDPIF